MHITANHVVLRNDVSTDVIANDHFCWGYNMAMLSEEETLKLINIMKQFPVLWQSDHKFYRKRGLRDAAMKKVATEFGDRGNWMNDSGGECVFAIGTYGDRSLRGAIAKTDILTQTQNNSLIVLIG